MAPKSRFTIRAKLIFSYIALSVLAGLLFSGSTFFLTRQYLQQDMRAKLKALVSVAAYQVDGDLHSQIDDPEDGLTPEYRALWTGLNHTFESDPDLSFVYTMRKNADGQILFIVDPSEEIGTEDSAPGDVYEDPSALLAAQFSSMDGPIVEEGYYTDEWGTFLSAYAPIYRSDGQREGVLGIDVSMETIFARERQILLNSLVVFLLVCLAALLAGQMLAKRITQPVPALIQSLNAITQTDLPGLVAATDALAGGDLRVHFSIQAEPIAFQSNDEFGDLVNGFNRMISQLCLVGNAFDGMTRQLDQLLHGLSAQVITLDGASRTLASAAQQAEQAVTQIVDTTRPARSLRAAAARWRPFRRPLFRCAIRTGPCSRSAPAFALRTMWWLPRRR